MWLKPLLKERKSKATRTHSSSLGRSGALAQVLPSFRGMRAGVRENGGHDNGVDPVRGRPAEGSATSTLGRSASNGVDFFEEIIEY